MQNKGHKCKTYLDIVALDQSVHPYYLILSLDGNDNAALDQTTLSLKVHSAADGITVASFPLDAAQCSPCRYSLLS